MGRDTFVAPRAPTAAEKRQVPDILGAVLEAKTDTQLIRAQLRYDYSLIPDAQRNQVQTAAVEIVRQGRRAQDSLIEVGKRLIEVKALLEHGQFGDWCKTEFQMSQSTVENMMNVAKTFGDKIPTVGILSDSVLYMLAAPSTPEPARIAVIEQAQATGKSPTKAQVQQVIAQHKPDAPRNNLGDALTEELIMRYWSGSERLQTIVTTQTPEQCRRSMVESQSGAATELWRYETYAGKVRAWHTSLGGDYWDREPDAIITLDRFVAMTFELAKHAGQPPAPAAPPPAATVLNTAPRAPKVDDGYDEVRVSQPIVFTYEQVRRIAGEHITRGVAARKPDDEAIEHPLDCFEDPEYEAEWHDPGTEPPDFAAMAKQDAETLERIQWPARMRDLWELQNTFKQVKEKHLPEYHKLTGREISAALVVGLDYMIQRLEECMDTFQTELEANHVNQ